MSDSATVITPPQANSPLPRDPQKVTGLQSYRSPKEVPKGTSPHPPTPKGHRWMVKPRVKPTAGLAWCRMLHLHQKSEPDLNQKFGINTASKAPPVCCTSKTPALCSRQQMTYNGMWAVPQPYSQAELKAAHTGPGTDRCKRSNPHAAQRCLLVSKATVAPSSSLQLLSLTWSESAASHCKPPLFHADPCRPATHAATASGTGNL